MTVAEAAKIIGCTPGTVIRLITSGRIRGKKVETPRGPYYTVNQQEVECIRDTPQTGPGFRRGTKRNGPRGSAV